MDQLNDHLFLLINAGAHPPGIVLIAALFLAGWLVPLVVVLFVSLWVRGRVRDRGGLLAATLTMLLAISANQLAGLVYFHPRPFMIGLGHQYLAHPPDNSFPSDHATFLWSLGFSLLALGVLRRWAVLLVAGGVAVAWARVYVGVHFPLDMAGSLAVALAVTRLASRIDRVTRRWLLLPCLALYEATIALFRLPPRLFHRQPAAARCGQNR